LSSTEHKTFSTGKRAAIYARLSDEDKHKKSYTDLSESIKNQIALLQEYALEHGWQITGIYCDDNWSGLDRDRPEFNRLLEDCKEGNIDIVLCKDMSRFTRDKIITEEYLETRFPEWNVRFIGLSDGSDTHDLSNKKSREINALVNQWYAEDISSKVRAAFKTKRRQGSFIGSYPPYGYVKSKTVKGRLEIDEEAALIVKKAFALYLAGHGTRKISQLFNDEGIPNPSGHKKLHSPRYKNPFKKSESSLWSNTSVKRILRNEVYIGNMIQHKNEKLSFKTKNRRNLPKCAWETVTGTHEPIIDPVTFAQVQRLLDSRIRSTGKGCPHLFAGKVTCKDCKNVMVKSSHSGFSYLTCSYYRTGSGRCSRHSIRLDQLTAAVEQRVGQMVSELLSRREEIVDYLLENDSFRSGIRVIRAGIERAETRVGEITAALKSLYLDKSMIITEPAVFHELKEEFITERKRLEQQLEELKERLNTAVNQKNRLQFWHKVLDKYTNPPELTREMVNMFINFIEVGEKNNGLQEIVIHFNFKNLC